MHHLSIFEMGMLLCFGAAWPVSIYKSVTTRRTEGKSVAFLIIVMVGYLSGLTHKLLYSFDFVAVLYILNFLMVGTDAVLYFRNRRLAAPLCEPAPPAGSRAGSPAHART